MQEREDGMGSFHLLNIVPRVGLGIASQGVILSRVYLLITHYCQLQLMAKVEKRETHYNCSLYPFTHLVVQDNLCVG